MSIEVFILNVETENSQNVSSKSISFDYEMRKKLKTNKNEYEKRNSSEKICNILLKCNLMQLNNKKFFNIRYEKNYS